MNENESYVHGTSARLKNLVIVSISYKDHTADIVNYDLEPDTNLNQRCNGLQRLFKRKFTANWLQQLTVSRTTSFSALWVKTSAGSHRSLNHLLTRDTFIQHIHQRFIRFLVFYASALTEGRQSKKWIWCRISLHNKLIHLCNDSLSILHIKFSSDPACWASTNHYDRWRSMMDM